jgi:PAS domain-containing protein
VRQQPRQVGASSSLPKAASADAAPGAISDEDLAVFLDMSTELFGVFDPEGGLAWGNASTAATLGYTEEELSGQLD